MNNIKLIKQDIKDDAVFIIGEIGINHNGSVEVAKELVDKAVEAGCNAVKLQKRNLENIYTDDVLYNVKNYEQGFQYLIPILKDYELSEDQVIEIKNYCDKCGITFICTPFDRESADFIDRLGVELYKVSSADLTNFYLLDHLVKFKKPILVSTGMSTFEEIDATVDFLRDKQAEFVLLHCVSSYPVNFADANMLRINALRERYDCFVGYSGHDEGILLSVSAVSLGAVVVEKHITLDKGQRGPDHKFSLLPSELNELCLEIRKIEKALYNKKVGLLQGELLNKMVFRKSLVAKQNIKLGEEIKEEMLIAKSPDSGLSVQEYFNLIGTKAKRDIKKDDLFYESDLGLSKNKDYVTSLDWAKQGYVVRYHDFETVLDYNPKCLEFHFTYKDTTLDIPFEKFEKYKHKLKDIILRIHCCEYIGEELFDICSPIEEKRLNSIKTLQRVIDITSSISKYFAEDKPLIVFNCGAMTINDEPNSVKLNNDIIYSHFKDLDYKNTGLMAQNMPPYPWYFGGQWRGHYFLEAEELIDFCEATGQSVCLDTSHGQMACTYLNIDFSEYAKKLMPYVKHLHISDATGIEGEGTQIDTGDVDFESFFNVYKDYDGTWIPEIWQGHVNNNYEAKRALEIISKKIRK